MNQFNVRDGRSFRDVVGTSNGGGGHRQDSRVSNGGPVAAGEKFIVVPDRTVAFRELFGVAMVGTTVILEILVDFHSLMRIAKIVFKRIQYLGGLSILVSFSDGESASRFLESQLFSKVIHVPEFLEEDQDLSVFKIEVLVGEALRIRESVTMRWKSRSFRVWVEEEQEIRVPDCLVSQGGISSDEGSVMQSSPVGNLDVSGTYGVEGTQKVEGWEEIEETPEENVGIPHIDVPMHEVGTTVGGGVEMNGVGPTRDEGGIKDGIPSVRSKEGVNDGGSVFNGLFSFPRSNFSRAHHKVNLGSKSRLGQAHVNKGSPPVDQRPKKRSRSEEKDAEPGFSFIGFSDRAIRMSEEEILGEARVEGGST
ncbi:hypothetical protein HanPSC8_Chr11g0492541 [Helianthus annuus]|nr:hypothetical protein HanPSC8_Chr11g0492541 [Helianthus annuus]